MSACISLILIAAHSGQCSLPRLPVCACDFHIRLVAVLVLPFPYARNPNQLRQFLTMFVSFCPPTEVRRSRGKLKDLGMPRQWS
jgi:hypothetical protein